MSDNYSEDLDFRECINRSTGDFGVVIYDADYKGDAYIYSDKFSKILNSFLPKKSAKKDLHKYVEQNGQEIDDNLLQEVEEIEESRYFIEERSEEYEVVDVLNEDKTVFNDIESVLITLAEKESEEDCGYYNTISYGNKLEICDIENSGAWLESDTVADVQP